MMPNRLRPLRILSEDTDMPEDIREIFRMEQRDLTRKSAMLIAVKSIKLFRTPEAPEKERSKPCIGLIQHLYFSRCSSTAAAHTTFRS